MADNPFAAATGGTAATPDNPFARAATPARKSGGGLLHTIARDSGAEFLGNAATDIANTAVNIGPGIYKVTKDAGLFLGETVRHPLRPQTPQNTPLLADLQGVGHQYADYYGHDLLHHLYTKPVQPILDLLTVASGGAGAAGKLSEAGVLPDRLATLGDRAQVVTRSPGAVTGQEGAPVHTALTSTRPLTKAAQILLGKARTARPEGRIQLGDKPLFVGGEFKQYGKTIGRRGDQQALMHLEPYRPYYAATKRLSGNELTAMQIRANDIHPDDLSVIWRGTPNAAALTPAVRKLALEPSKGMLKAEPTARALSNAGAELLGPRLSDASEALRPGAAKTFAETALGRPPREITGDPYYMPHTPEPVRSASPIGSRGGGKAPPRVPGTVKQNKGVLFLNGKLHLRGDVLGPEFLRRVKWRKYESIHDALIQGAVRVTRAALEQHYQGKLPNGWEYVREKPGQRIPVTMRGESDIPLHELIPNPDELHTSELSDGFTTAQEGQAAKDGGTFYIVPKSTARAATGEFARTSPAVRALIYRPLSFWRSIVLGLRVGFLTNNLVGNAIMYSVRTGGRGALRDLFGAILETHGKQVGLKLLRDPATPPDLAADFYREFYPEQIQGTHGLTQSPAVSTLSKASSHARQVGRDVTGAIPRLTAKVAEEYPRRGLIRHFIRTSPEFRRVYRSLPRQTRTFMEAARKLHEGMGGREYQEVISRQVNNAMGDYLNMSPFMRNVVRNAFPFAAWYRAIVTTTAHLAIDAPLRAQALNQLGKIGEEYTQATIGDVPTYLEGAVGVGSGKGGTTKILTTQGLNPYATLAQLERRDVTGLGLNPFFITPLTEYAKAAVKQHSTIPKVSIEQLLGHTLQSIVTGLPPARVGQPLPPSTLYPNRDRRSEALAFLGATLKDLNAAEAARQKQAGR